jgi:hypothetical protein
MSFAERFPVAATEAARTSGRSQFTQPSLVDTIPYPWKMRENVDGEEGHTERWEGKEG